MTTNMGELYVNQKSIFTIHSQCALCTPILITVYDVWAFGPLFEVLTIQGGPLIYREDSTKMVQRSSIFRD